MAPKKNQETTRQSKRKIGETSSRVQNTRPNFDLSPENRYLFRDDATYRTYYKLRNCKLSGCYYFDPLGQIGTGYLEKIDGWLHHMNMRKLATIIDTCSTLSIRGTFGLIACIMLHHIFKGKKLICLSTSSAKS